MRTVTNMDATRYRYGTLFMVSGRSNHLEGSIMKNVVRQTVVLFALILLCAAGTAHSAGVDMKDGNWEISTETTMVGMPMPPMANKSTFCLTQEELVPKSEKDKECKIVSQKITGNTVSWRMECKKGEGEGEISYRGTTYNGFFKMKMVEDGQTMNMNMKLAGKYLGPCPKGQKSGATGETAKQMAAGQQAAAQAQQMQAEQEALRKKCEEFVKRTAVPADDPGMCEQDGFTRSKGCEEKFGKLNLEYGQYEIIIEVANRISSSCGFSETKRKTLCLNMDDPVPQELRPGRQVRKVKRGKDKITWRESSESGETLGGIVYRGTSFEGVVIQKSRPGPGMEHLQVTKVTGRRVGVGDCPKEVDSADVGRGYTAKKKGGDSPTQTDNMKKGGDSATHTDNILKNPVKGIRNLFGY
jgi:hypothetical protein